MQRFASDEISTPPAGTHYRVVLGEREVDVYLDGSRATIDGQAYDVSLAPIPGGYSLLVDGVSYRVAGAVDDAHGIALAINGVHRDATVKDARTLLLEAYGGDAAATDKSREVRAPMPGLVVNVMVRAGEEVARGDGLVILEAMKMENELRAGEPGTIAAVHVSDGDAVSKNQLLIEIAPL